MKFAWKQFFTQADKLTFNRYFFTGPEHFLKIRAKDKLLARPDWKGYSIKRAGAKDIDFQELWNLLNSGGLFQEGQIIIIEQCDKFSAASKKTLIDILEKIDDEGPMVNKILIFISQKERMDAADPLEGHIMAGPSGCHVFCPVLDENDILSWAKGELRRRRIEVEPKALSQAVTAISTDLYSWMNLINHLELLRESPIGSGQIASLLGAGTIHEEKLYDDLRLAAFESLSRKTPADQSLKQILGAAEQLTGSSSEGPQETVLKILRLFADGVYELGAAKAGAYSSIYRHHPELADLIRKAAGLWNWDGVKTLYDLLLQAERHIKKGILNPEAALRKFVYDYYELCSNSLAR